MAVGARRKYDPADLIRRAFIVEKESQNRFKSKLLTMMMWKKIRRLGLSTIYPSKIAAALKGYIT